MSSPRKNKNQQPSPEPAQGGEEHTGRKTYPGHLRIRFAPDGRIIIEKDIDALNRFLNRNVDDPRLRGRTWMPSRQKPGALIASLTLFDVMYSLQEVKSIVERKGFRVVDMVEANTLMELEEALCNREEMISLLVLLLNQEDGVHYLRRLKRCEFVEVPYVVAIGRGISEVCTGGKWLYGGKVPTNRRFEKLLENLWNQIMEEDEWSGL